MITAAEVHLNFKKIVINLFIYLGICFSSLTYATDYNISSSTTSRITLGASDTLTVTNGGDITYTGWPAVAANGVTFSSGTTQVTNAGTISATTGYNINFTSSTRPTLVNSGTITTPGTRPIYAGSSANASITNSGTISQTGGSGYTGIYADSSTDMTITNSGTISTVDDKAILAWDSDDMTINNTGTISAGGDYGIQGDNADGLTVTNSGTISAGGVYAIYIRNADNVNITNSGTITSARDPINMQSSTGTVSITNSGTISQTGGGYNDGLTLQDNATFTNTGTLTASRYAIGGSSSGVTIVNKGTITGGTYDFYVPSMTITTLTNGQGASDALVYRGKMPTNYKLFVASTSSYGKFAKESGTSGTTTFSIDTASSLAANTYTDVFTNTTSSRFAGGLTGTCVCSNGVFTWTLSDGNGDDKWDLAIAADTTKPTTTFSPVNGATSIAVASDITLTFNEAVRLINNSALDDSNVDALITLKENNSSGTDISFDATINADKTVITINPSSSLSSEQVVYVAIGATVEDASNNAINAASASFTAVDTSAPTMVITSSTVSDGDTSDDASLSMTFTSSEATTDFIVGDITVTGGSLSSFASTSSTIYTATFTPTDDGATTIDVASSKFTDATGNDNVAATQFNWTYESQLPSPLDKPDVTSSVEASKDIAAEWADMIVDISYNRIAWLGRNQGSIRTSHQGIRLRFNDEMIDILMNSSPNYQIYDEIYFANKMSNAIENTNGSLLAVSDHIKSDAATIAMNEGVKLRALAIETLNPTFEPIFGDWSIWTKGELIIGKTKASSTTSKQDTKSKILSLGFDKPLDNEGIVGFVFDVGRDNSDIGSGATNVKSKNYSLSNYSALKLDSNTKIETVVGISRINFDMTRTDGSETLLGERRGNQLFLSNILRHEYKKKQFEISPYLTYSATLTNLDAFSESSGSLALTFNKQEIRDQEIGMGMDVNSEILLKNSGKLKPFTRIEYNKSNSKTSTSMFYTSEGASNTYVKNFDIKNNNWKLRVGIDHIARSGWRSSASYTRKQTVGANSESKYSNSFTLRSDLRF
jgi:hypothetical protein